MHQHREGKDFSAVPRGVLAYGRTHAIGLTSAGGMTAKPTHGRMENVIYYSNARFVLLKSVGGFVFTTFVVPVHWVV